MWIDFTGEEGLSHIICPQELIISTLAVRERDFTSKMCSGQRNNAFRY